MMAIAQPMDTVPEGAVRRGKMKLTFSVILTVGYLDVEIGVSMYIPNRD
jgi:hypothetical protein